MLLNIRLRIAAAVLFALTFLLLTGPASESTTQLKAALRRPNAEATNFLAEADSTAATYLSNPLSDGDFHAMGERVRDLQQWLKAPQHLRFTRWQTAHLKNTTETVIGSLFPFLKEPFQGMFRGPQGPLALLRSRFRKETRGLVIPVGKANFRYACHLIANLKIVLKSDLPIQIAYAGEDDLPTQYRRHLFSLHKRITAFDVTQVFDGQTLDLENGGWAIKAFALLGSSFEQAILIDADATFLQPPETILDSHPQYLGTGTLLFHDRLIWQGAFPERQQWWGKELANFTLSTTTRASKVFTENWAEEGDSGVVVVDKSRIEVLMGLLHICWQNTASVREHWTYKMGYGDKESWWFGFELSGVPYSMEAHYASILGELTTDADSGTSKVCSFDIAHVDHEDRLLWCNGGLLNNKKLDPLTFANPNVWMIDGIWEKGPDRTQPSCMKGNQINQISEYERMIVMNTIDAAKETDNALRERFPGLIPSEDEHSNESDI